MKKFLSNFPFIRTGFISIICLLPLVAFTQSLPIDTAMLFQKAACGSDADYLLQGGVDVEAPVISWLVPPPSFPDSLILHCGKFDVFFEDRRSHFHRGFDDSTRVGTTTVGEQRRNTFCAVLTYVQSVFDFSNVDPLIPVRIYVDTSFDPIVHPSTGLSFYARAAAMYDTSFDGIKKGWVADYITGTSAGWHLVDSIAPDRYHAMMQYNFDRIFIPTFPPEVIYWSNSIDSYQCGHFDLYSTILHEVTHAMGWYSLVKFTGTGSMGLLPVPAIFSHNIFSALDWSMYAGAIYPTTGGLTKLIAGTPTAPYVSFSGGLANDNNYWLNNNTAPENAAVYSGFYPGPYNAATGSYLSHLDDQQLSYTCRQRISPGDRQEYVMGPFSIAGVRRRTYTKGEIQNLVSILGYTLKTTFTASHPHIAGNHVPFSSKMAGYGITFANYGAFTETVTPDHTLTNDVGASQTVSITSLIASGAISDADAGDTANLYIDSTTIVNFRGCGTGGNNHSLLSVSSDSKSITYAPRADFYGKAQFAFNLTDGKEKGAYMVMTIEVLKGNNVNAAAGTNLICNSDFEEGTEVTIDGYYDYVPNAVMRKGLLHESKWQGIQFSDSHPYGFYSNLNWFYGFINASGVVIQRSTDNCTYDTLGSHGINWLNCVEHSVGAYTADNPAPKDSIGHRYQTFMTTGESYYYLADSARPCHRYLLEFDLYRTLHEVDNFPLRIGLTDTLVNIGTTTPILRYLKDTTLSLSTHTWVHYTIPFWHCGTRGANALYLSSNTTGSRQVQLDNISLKEDTMPPALIVTITSRPLTGCRTELTAHVTNAACDVTYLWVGGTFLSSTTGATVIVASSVTATYSVIVSDGCRDTAATFSIFDATPDPIAGPTSVCEGLTITLTDAVPGGAWTSSNTAIATVDLVSGVVTGTGGGVVTISYTTFCSHTVTYAVTVHAVPPITGTPLACVGTTTTLANAIGGGEWTSSNTAIATIGSASGIVTGVATGITTITYTLPSGCTTTVSVAISPTLPPITGSSWVCSGSTIPLSNAYTGGIWSSSNTAIATVGSATGIVTGVSAGTATITYSSPCGDYVTQVVSVDPTPPITGNAPMCLSYSLYLSNIIPGGTWTSSNPTIASIHPSVGHMIALAVGTATITYTTPCGDYITVVATVYPIPAAISGLSNVCVGTTITLTDATPGGTWISSNPARATVGSASGVVTGLSAGVVDITYVIACGPVIKSVTVNAVPPAIWGPLRVCHGLTMTLGCSPGGTWTSSNPSVATIGSSSGMVTGITAGTATITYSLGGCVRTRAVTVDLSPSPITGITTICIGTTTTLNSTPSGGTWSGGSTAISIDPITGVVTSAGTVGWADFAYSTGLCVVQTTVNVVNATAAIIGAATVCVGATTALSDATPFGTWSSGSTGVATVGSSSGIVTGVSSGTAVITYLLGGTCYSTLTVTVHPVPGAISGATSVCRSATTTLTNTVSGGTWSSSNPSIASIGSSSGVVTGVASGTVTITYTLPGGCYTTASLTVHPIPNNITGTATVCEGANTTLNNTVSGGTWSSSAITIATVSAGSTSGIGIVTGVSAGTAFITYTMPTTGCYVTKAVTVNAIPTAIAGDVAICLGGTHTYTGTPTGGTWTSSSTGVATIGSVLGVATGISVGSATITYTLSTGCYRTLGITVGDTVDCTPCHMFGGSYMPLGLSGTINTSIGAGEYYIANNVTVVGSITFTGATVLISAGDTIFIDTASMLTLDDSHLLGLCDLWEGMRLMPGTTHSGRLYLINNSMVEDAVTAAYADRPYKPTSGYVLNSDGAIFNRNRTGVHITHYNSKDATYPFQLRNTVFTSRDLGSVTTGYPMAWPGTTGAYGLKTPASVPGAPFTAQYNIDSSHGGETGPYDGATLKNGGVAYIGIRLDSIGTDTATTPTGYVLILLPDYYTDITIGDASSSTDNEYLNMFDNLVFGVHATNANVTVVNGVFKHMNSFTAPSTIPGSLMGGAGVFTMTTNDGVKKNRLRVHKPTGSLYGNSFYNCYTGVESYGYFHITANNSFVTSTHGSSAMLVTGRYGFRMSSPKYDSVTIDRDTINNVQNGIAFWTSRGSMADYPYVPQYAGRLEIMQNLIQAHPSGYGSITTQSVAQAIAVQNVISSHSFSLALARDSVYVDDNVINDAYNGIFVSNYWRQRPLSNINTIRIRRLLQKRAQYGINHTGCKKSIVYGNDVEGSTIAAADNDSMKAFYSASNSLMDMGCNDERIMGRGFEFFMPNPGMRWHDNTMEDNKKGMVLNGGAIGPQHYLGHPTMDNKWLGTWSTPDTQTYVYSTNSASSPIYVYDDPLYKPILNGGSPPLFRYSPSVGSTSIYTVTPGLDEPGDPCTPIHEYMPADTADLYTLIAQMHVPYVYSVVSNNWIGQFALWKTIITDSMFIDSSAVIAVFDSMAKGRSRYKYLTDIEEHLINGEFDSAVVKLGYDINAMVNTDLHIASQVQMADDTTANFIVENYRQFYNLYIKYVTATLEGTDSLDLLALASLCPQREGAVVFQARSLYSLVFDHLDAFNDDSCLDVDTAYIAAKPFSNNNKEEMNNGSNDQRYELYPNPNNGQFVIKQYLKDEKPVMVTVSDVIGRRVYQKEQHFTSERVDLHLRNASPGMYLLEIKDDKNQIFRRKFVVEK